MSEANARIAEIVNEQRHRAVHEGHSRCFRNAAFPAARSPSSSASARQYETVDVLQDPEIRQGIKEYSDWPTVPQLYVKGEFVGGSDIMMEMFESGELQQLLGARQPGD